jgi:hypothetical protein
LKRKLTEKLTKWKREGRLPLLLQGARQVGKTYTLKEFASQHYSSMVYVNFELNPALHSLFDGDISPERIIGYLEMHFNQKIEPGRTLQPFFCRPDLNKEFRLP